MTEEEYSLVVAKIIQVGDGTGITIPKKKRKEQELEKGDYVKILMKKIHNTTKKGE